MKASAKHFLVCIRRGLAELLPLRYHDQVIFSYLWVIVGKMPALSVGLLGQIPTNLRH